MYLPECPLPEETGAPLYPPGGATPPRFTSSGLGPTQFTHTRRREAGLGKGHSGGCIPSILLSWPGRTGDPARL